MSEDKVVEALELFSQAMENAVQVLKQSLAKIEKPQTQSSTIPEQTFNVLKWEASKGERLGEFEVAYQNHNIVDQWQHAFNILKANHSTIENSFHGEGYQYHYWLYLDKYNDRIFRKKLEPKEKKAS